nr:hypothetical protein Iba_chr01fCG9950 [Ipomoea batatas]
MLESSSNDTRSNNNSTGKSRNGSGRALISLNHLRKAGQYFLNLVSCFISFPHLLLGFNLQPLYRSNMVTRTFRRSSHSHKNMPAETRRQLWNFNYYITDQFEV